MTTTGGKSKFLNLPNQLTIARLVLSIVFFVVLALVGHGVFGPAERSLALNVSTVLFIFAVVTDFLDGYFARKLGLESTFGRIADPFVDKIVICGGFIMLISVSKLVEPWFPVLIVLREFLVSGLRSFLEARGVAFGASLSGKLKMFVQSLAIPAVLIHEANFADPNSTPELLEALATPVYWITLGLLAATLFLTLSSCVSYLQRAVRHLRA